MTAARIMDKRGSLEKELDTTGAMSVDLSGYQPAGSYLTSVPIGGTAIGGVKNGGNVTINADGTMNSTPNTFFGTGEISDIIDFLNNHSKFIMFVIAVGHTIAYNCTCMLGPFSDYIGYYSASGIAYTGDDSTSGPIIMVEKDGNTGLVFHLSNGYPIPTYPDDEVYGTALYWD